MIHVIYVLSFFNSKSEINQPSVCWNTSFQGLLLPQIRLIETTIRSFMEFYIICTYCSFSKNLINNGPLKHIPNCNLSIPLQKLFRRLQLQRQNFILSQWNLKFHYKQFQIPFSNDWKSAIKCTIIFPTPNENFLTNTRSIHDWFERNLQIVLSKMYVLLSSTCSMKFLTSHPSQWFKRKNGNRAGDC